MKIKSEHVTARSDRAALPSTDSLSDGGSRAMATRPITNGATVTMPTASDANQWYQIVRADAADRWNNKKPTVPPIPETAHPMIAAVTNPSTRYRLSSLNGKPKYRSIRSATSTASNALHAAKTIELGMLRSPRRLAAMVAAMTPTMTGNRTLGPSPIITPAETPAAGQKTATPSGFREQRKAQPCRQKIGNAYRNRETCRNNPRRKRSSKCWCC